MALVHPSELMAVTARRYTCKFYASPGVGHGSRSSTLRADAYRNIRANARPSRQGSPTCYNNETHQAQSSSLVRGQTGGSGVSPESTRPGAAQGEELSEQVP